MNGNTECGGGGKRRVENRLFVMGRIGGKGIEEG